MVAYGRWLLTRAWTILGQNIASLAYSNWKTFKVVSFKTDGLQCMWIFLKCFDVLFICKSQFRLHSRKLSNFRHIICQVVAHWRLKTKENFKSLLWEWPRSFTRGGRLQELLIIENIVIWFGKVWYFTKKTGHWGEAFAEERWSQTQVRLCSLFDLNIPQCS